MSGQVSLFDGGKRPAPAPKPKSKGSLIKQMLAKFRQHRYLAFPESSILKAFPDRTQKSVHSTIQKLLRQGKIKVVTAPGQAIRYTLTLYK